MSTKISTHISRISEQIKLFKEYWFGKDNPRACVLFTETKEYSTDLVVMHIKKSSEDIGLLRQKFKLLGRKAYHWYVPKIQYIGRAEPDLNPNNYWRPVVVKADNLELIYRYIDRFQTWNDLREFHWENYKNYLLDCAEYERYRRIKIVHKD